jgi:hypothetical protein
MAYEAVGFDPGSNTLAAAVKQYLDGVYGQQFTYGVTVGSAYNPALHTLVHDVGTTVVSSAGSGAVTFGYPRNYVGICFLKQVVGDRNDSVDNIQPIVANMNVSGGFNGIAFNHGGGAAANLTFRVNYEVWGWF